MHALIGVVHFLDNDMFGEVAAEQHLSLARSPVATNGP